MSRHTQKPSLSIGCRRRLLAALAVTLSSLLFLAAPAVHAQEPHHWGGYVEVDTNGDGMDDGGGGTLKVDAEGSITYRIRLSEQPTEKKEGGTLVPVDGWWIILRVDGGMRADGDYNGIDWVPSVGWEFTATDWDRWRTITISGTRRESVYDGNPIEIQHEVWDHQSKCPFKGSGLTVQVVNAPPALSIPNVTVEEGDLAVFQVRLSKPSSQTVTVKYTTEDVTASAGQDYTSMADTLTFGPGTRIQTFSVPTTDDTDEERTETFRVRLTSPNGATLAKGTATGTITDNDTDGGGNGPALSIANAAASEGDPVVFTVTVSGTRTGNVTVDYDTADGTAQQGLDYTTPTSRTLTFTPTDNSMTISVPTIQDTIEEANETFTVTLTSSDATVQDGSATGTINDNDSAPPPPPPPHPHHRGRGGERG